MKALGRMKFQRSQQLSLMMGALSVCGVIVAACSSEVPEPELEDEPPAGLEWGDKGPSFLTDKTSAELYTGDSEPVLEAQERLPTGSALHSEVVLRSCGPLGGVCHNRKEYPDMRTPSNFVGLIGAPCNVQSGSVGGIFDRCERPGDRVTFGGSGVEHEIGWLEVVPGEPSGDPSAEMPGLHLHLAEPVGEDELGRYNTTARFFRTFVYSGDVEDLSYATYESRWHSFEGGLHVVAEIPSYRADAVANLVNIGIEQGDMNRNGTYGARPDEDGVSWGPVPLIAAGDPETSYLVARLRGHMEGREVPGSRMPLANPPFSVAEMVSLFCFIEGLPASGEVNLESAIDYKNCSYSDPSTHAALSIEGAGKGWSDRVSPLLEANCGGCHSEERAEGDLVLVGSGVYDFLLDEKSPTDPLGRSFITPGDPQNSYLFLKLKGDASIEGKQMPIDPLLGERTLSNTELADIETWITDGAAP